MNQHTINLVNREFVLAFLGRDHERFAAASDAGSRLSDVQGWPLAIGWKQPRYPPR